MHTQRATSAHADSNCALHKTPSACIHHADAHRPGRYAKALRCVQKLQGLAVAVRGLCQDLSQDVRQAVCEAVLAPLAQALGPTVATQMLLADLVELVQVRLSRRVHLGRACNVADGAAQSRTGVPAPPAPASKHACCWSRHCLHTRSACSAALTSSGMQDDHPAVRNAALDALTRCIPHFSKAAGDKFWPVLRSSVFRTAAQPSTTQRELARLMNALPLALCPMQPGDRAQVFGCFHALAASADACVREHCVRAFPAVVMALLTDPVAALDGPFLHTFNALAADPEVRLCKRKGLPPLLLLL